MFFKVKLAFVSLPILFLSGSAFSEPTKSESTYQDLEDFRNTIVGAAGRPAEYANDGTEEERSAAFTELGLLWAGLCRSDFPEPPEGERRPTGLGILINFLKAPSEEKDGRKSVLKTVPIIDGLDLKVPRLAEIHRKVKEAGKDDAIPEVTLSGKVKNWRKKYDVIAKELMPEYSTPDKNAEFALQHEGKPVLGFQIHRYTNHEDEANPRKELLLTAFCPTEMGCDFGGSHFKHRQTISICFLSSVPLEGAESVLPKK